MYILDTDARAYGVGAICPKRGGQRAHGFILQPSVERCETELLRYPEGAVGHSEGCDTLPTLPVQPTFQTENGQRVTTVVVQAA